MYELEELDSAESGTPNASTLLTDSESFLQYLISERKHSPNTVSAYNLDLTRFRAWVESTGVNYLTPSHAEMMNYIEHLRAAHLADATVARHVHALKSFHAFLTLHERPVNRVIPDLCAPTQWQRLHDVLTEKECLRLVKAPLANPDNPYKHRNIAILEFLWATGVRASEACDAKLIDLHLADGVCRIVGKGNKHRIVPFGESCRMALQTYLVCSRPAWQRRQLLPKQDDPTPWLFLSRRGKQLTRSTLYDLILKYARLAGLTGRIHPHVLRHSCATQLLSGGMPILMVAEMLGHENLQTTSRYLRVDSTRLRKIHDEHHPRGKKASQLVPAAAAGRVRVLEAIEALTFIVGSNPPSAKRIRQYVGNIDAHRIELILQRLVEEKAIIAASVQSGKGATHSTYTGYRLAKPRKL